MSGYQRLGDSGLFSSEPRSDRLAIFCSGRNMGFRVDKFSFTRRTEMLNINRLFIRDNFGLWYQRGLSGMTTNLRETLDYLDEFRTRRGFRRISIAGVSSGGYAALYLGSCLGASVIHAISPRTLLHVDTEEFADRNRHGVRKSLIALEKLPPEAKTCTDLAACLRDTPPTAEICVVHYDPAHALDTFHARRLADVPGVTFQQYPNAGHTLGKRIITDPGVRAQLCG